MLPQKYHSLVIKRKINCYSCTNGGNLKSYISKTSIVCPKKKKNIPKLIGLSKSSK